MNIYKSAELQIFNKDSLIQQVLSIPDREFEIYIEVLSQIHSSLLDGVELEDAAIDAAGEFYARKLIRLIEDIGLENFKRASDAEISTAIRSIREPEPEEEIELELDDDTEEGPARPEFGFTPEKAISTPEPEDAPVLELDDELTTDDVMFLSPEDRIEYLSNLQFPKQLESTSSVLINNVKSIQNLLIQDLPEETINRLTYELTDAVSELINLSKQEFPDEAESEIVGQEQVLPESKPAVVDVKKKEITIEVASSNLKDDDILEQDIFSNTSVKLLQEKSSNPYIDYTTSPPTLDTSNLDIVFGNFVSKIAQIMQSVAARSYSASGYDSITDIRKQFNDLVFSVKRADYIAYHEFVERKRLASNEEKSAYDVIEAELKNWMPSQRILFDADFHEEFFTASILCGARKLGRLLFLEDNDVFEAELKKDPRNDHITPDQIDMIKTQMTEFVRTAFESKCNEYFQLNNTYKQNDFLSKISLRWDLVLIRTVQKNIVHGPEYTYKPCPTCFKYIPWSYSSDAKKVVDDYENMMVHVYSFFTKDPDRPKITLEYLRSQKWNPLDPSEYTNERERVKVAEYKKVGPKSWDEIVELLNSNDLDKQEEGLHRRAGALAAAGGIRLAVRNISASNLMTRCPSGDKGAPGCGISFSPKQSVSLPGAIGLQPEWNSQKTNKISSTQNVQTLHKEMWSDEALFEKAKMLQRGGRKFSKLNFACTCMIQEVNAMTGYKHGNIAISKVGPAGSDGFFPPTNPDGTLNTNIENGTLAFLVCGAPTSLSCFDRNEENAGFILKYLLDIKNQSVGDYASLVGFLIRYGLDFNDVMDLDQNLELYFEKSYSDLNKDVKARICRLKDIIKVAQIKMQQQDGGVGSELRRLLGGLTLVCPFGHRFTVEHSLQFGDKYAGIYSSSAIGTDTGQLYKIVTKQGLDNIAALVGSSATGGPVTQSMLVSADDPNMEGFIKLPYDEWVKHDNRTVFPILKNLDRPVLVFKLPLYDGSYGDFMFSSKFNGAKDNVWSGSQSFSTPSQQIAYMELSESEKAAISSTVITSDSKELNLIDAASAKSWEIDKFNERVDDGFNTLPSRAIPGCGNLYDEDDEVDQEQMDKRIASFSRAITSSLRVIKTWTEGVVTSGMIESFITQRTVDLRMAGNVFGLDSKLFDMLIPDIVVEAIDNEGEEYEPVGAHRQSLINAGKDAFISNLNEKVNNLYDWIRTTVYSLDNSDSFNKSVAKTVLSAGIREFNQLEAGGDDGFVYLNIPKSRMESYSDEMALKMLRAYPELIGEITLTSRYQNDYEKKRIEYIGRVTLVSYAHYLANALSRIYKKYCSDPNSNLYIGYDIGVDLSSPDNIIGFEKDGEWYGGLSDSDIANITSSLSDVEGLGGFPQLSPQTIDYGHRIDKAWLELESYLITARNQALSARGMENAKEYIISKTSYMTNQDLDDIKSKISRVFPNKSILFNGTDEMPETGTSLVHKHRLPYLTKKGKQLKDLDKTVRVNMWGMRDVETGNTEVFNLKADADEALNRLKEENPDAQVEIRNIGYYINDEYGYDGSKLQIGVTAPKVGTEMKWPPPIDGYNFVGINLPFDIQKEAQDASVNKAKDIPISSFKIEVDFDGKPLDISFLMRRGQSDSDKKDIRNRENIILSKSMDSKRNIELFIAQNSEKIKVDQSLLINFEAKERDNLMQEIRPHLKAIEAISLELLTTKSYIDANTGKPRPMLRASLVDPITAYKLINNPELRGVTLTNDERERYIQFIIRVYNIDLIRDLARKNPKYENIQSRDLLEGKFNAKLGFLKSDMKDSYLDSPGEYFSVLPGSKESESGSYFQYVYSTSPNVSKYFPQGRHPDVKTLVGAASYAKVHGLVNSGELDISGDTLSQKIESDMLKYITSRTSGERKNPVIDKNAANHGSKFSYEIFLRRSNLERMILSLGVFNFDDVKMPNF